MIIIMIQYSTPTTLALFSVWFIGGLIAAATLTPAPLMGWFVLISLLVMITVGAQVTSRMHGPDQIMTIIGYCFGGIFVYSYVLLSRD